MSEMNSEIETNEGSADLIYAIAAGPGAVAGQSGLIFAAASSGLRRSLDGGQSWTDTLEGLNLSEPVPVTSLAVSPIFEKDMRVVAGASGGVFLSTDGGESWNVVLFPSPPPTVSALVISPNYEKDESIIAATMEDGVFISRDGGESWVAWNFGLLDLNVVCMVASPNYTEDETLLAGTETGIFRSTNGGRAWRDVEMPFGYDPVLSLAFSANFRDNQTVYAGTENQGLWVSHDGGDSWSRLAEEILVDPINNVLLSGTEVMVATGDALWHSTDSGATWQNRMPVALDEVEISTLLALQGFDAGAALLAGFTDGSIVTLQLN